MDQAKQQTEQIRLTLHAAAELADLLLKPAVLLPDRGKLRQSSLPTRGFSLPGLPRYRVLLLAGLLGLKALPQALCKGSHTSFGC